MLFLLLGVGWGGLGILGWQDLYSAGIISYPRTVPWRCMRQRAVFFQGRPLKAQARAL